MLAAITLRSWGEVSRCRKLIIQRRNSMRFSLGPFGQRACVIPGYWQAGLLPIPGGAVGSEPRELVRGGHQGAAVGRLEGAVAAVGRDDEVGFGPGAVKG